jgi:hypothetical protein
VACLTRSLPTDHFHIRYALRNPETGEGAGCHGVRRPEMVVDCARALEMAYQALTGEPWNRAQPVCDGGILTPVYICDISAPVTFPYRWRVPAIILRSRNCEPNLSSETQCALAETVHEVAHVFNFREHPMNDPASKCWAWLDEGLAVCFEEWLLPDNRDRYRFLMNWVDCPEVSLDDRNAVYQTGMFVRYLANRFGKQLVNDVWTKSARHETPFAAINRLLPDGLKFVSPGTAEPDVFSDYCRDAYFLRNPASYCYAPPIQERFGARAITESFELSPGNRCKSHSELNHLACRYFRFRLKPGATKLNVQMLTRPPAGLSPLKAELAVVTKAGKRGESQMLRPLLAMQPAEPVRLFGQIVVPQPDDVDHLVLTVANCGIRPEPANIYLPHDDGQEFMLEVSAE